MIDFREVQLGALADPIGPDEFFVMSSWTQSYRTANTAGILQEDDYYPVMDQTVRKILRRPDVRTIVATIPGSADHIADLYGFITVDTTYETPLVYYVFVKLAYRRAGNGRLWSGPGVARQLFAAAGVDPNFPFHYVCSTPMARTLERKIPLARWRPLLGRFPKERRQ